jgi:hypothetical protein
MNIDFIPTLPSELQPSVPFSSSDFIAAKREKIFLPDSQTTYSFEGNDRMVFTLNSNNELIDGRNSWIEFDLAVTATGDSLNATQLTQRIIDVGGAHALFKRLQISLSNGTQIEDITGYNKLYSIMRLNTMSENHVRYVEHVSGDGMVSDVYDASSPYDNSVWRDVTYVQADANYDHTGGAFEQLLILGANAAAANALSELAVGDILRVETAALNYTARVLTIESNFQVTIEGLPAADLEANAILSLKVARKNGTLSTRYRTGSTTAIKLKMKPFSNFFQSPKFVPLLFMKNLQFTFELERGALAFRLLAAPGNNASITYTITNPRFICSMITPSEQVLNGMLEAYNSQEGIYYTFISFQHNLKFVAAGTSGSVTIPSNCRSAKAFIATQYLAISEAVAAGSYVLDTISTTPKNLMTQFQLKIGSENYPYSRAVDTDDIYNGDTLSHLQKALDLHGNIIFSNSMIPSDYYAVNTVNGVADESKRFVMGVRLARDMGSEATGVDLINNDIQFEYTRSAAGVDTYLRSWVIFDSGLKISRAASILFK